MTIYEWLDKLGGPVRTEGNRYWCYCPVHSDRGKPNLHVYVGDDGMTVMYCHACQANGKAVAQALGVPMKELMCDAISGERSPLPQRVAKAKSEKKSKPCRPLCVGDKWKDTYTVKAVYAYRDRDGREVLLKSRAEWWEGDTRKDKTFVVQSLAADGKWQWGGGIYTDLLYHLPDVLSCAANGGRIIIAEGEKDIDNLRAVGFTATCGMNGGGRGDLGKKWFDAHTEKLDGAGEVIVIADHDAAGEGLAQHICKSLKKRGKVGEIRLLRIADHYPDLPAKGDFTDWVALLKDQGVKKKSDLIAAMNTMIDATPLWNPKDIRKFEKEEDKTVSADGFDDGEGVTAEGEYPSYHGSSMYCIKSNRLAMRVGRDGAKCLCDFLPEPKEIILRDDGSRIRTDFVIGATDPAGRPLPDAVVEGVDRYQSMRWPLEAWGHYGNLKVIKNAAQHVLDAINTAGQTASRHREVYEHTGWRKIDGQWVYLYNGGAIGAQDVSVEMTGDLKRYNLDDCGVDLFEAACSELLLLDAFPARIVYPQMAQAYLAPVYSVMEDMQQPPSYAVMVIGKSNAGKSTIASYVLAHFGTFYNREFPASFENTPNGVRDKLFYVKDSLLVVDDYFTQKDGRTRNPHDMVANAIISAVADRSGRARLDADKRLSGSKPCRGMCIMTGEDLPQITDSRQLRIYKIDVSPGEIYTDVSDLEPYRQMARHGDFRQVMRAYIDNLRERYDDLGKELEGRILEASDMMREAVHRKEGRLIECATHMMVGVGLMLDHLKACGVIDEDEKARRMKLAAEAIAANIDEQGRAVDEGKPEEVWLETLRSLLATRSVTLLSELESADGDGFRAGMVGFKREDEYWFVPEAVDEFVAERLRKGGKTLGASRQAILRALVRAGKIIPEPRKGSDIGNPTSSMRVGTKRKARVIRIPRWVIDDPENPPKPEELGYIPVDSEQLPMEIDHK